MSSGLTIIDRGNNVFEVKEKKGDRSWRHSLAATVKPSTFEDEAWASPYRNDYCDTSASELRDIAAAYTRDTPLSRTTERSHLEDPVVPETWTPAGFWEGCAYLRVEDGANDRGFMEPVERTPLRRSRSSLLEAAKKTAFERYADEEENLSDYYEFFDWADKEWTESYAGRPKEEILERDLFLGGFRDWTPPELKARFGVTSKAYLMRVLRRRKLVMCDGEAYDATVSTRTIRGTSDDGNDGGDNDDNDDDDLERRDGKTLWGEMTQAEQDAFSTALAQDEVGMCQVSGLCDLPEFEDYPQAVFVPLSPTRENFEPRTP
ncbi:hypothetical protein PG985_013801 [Apiospora marii]|uniref:uncharacterized protein n=1 Tax=Apiospora marii TaxID=335849 RepID=UPI00312CE6E7